MTRGIQCILVANHVQPCKDGRGYPSKISRVTTGYIQCPGSSFQNVVVIMLMLSSSQIKL